MSIYDKLFDWQKKLVDNYKYKKDLGLFLDCGLGKTPLALALSEINNCSKVIVITINGKAVETEENKGSWFDWAKKSNINYILCNKKHNDFENNRPELFLINYESLQDRSNSIRTGKNNLRENIQDFIKSCKNNNVAIIVDESHKMKNLQSIQTKCLNKLKTSLKLVSNSVYTYLLTGTPFTTGYIDLYSQLKFLGYQENKNEFVDKYCIRGNLPGLLGWQQPIIGYKNINKLFDLVHSFAITIKTEEVYNNLPEKIFIEHISKNSIEMKLLTYEKYKKSEIIKYCNNKKIKIPDYINSLEKDININNPFYRNIDYPNIDYLAETSGSFWLRARQLSIGFQGNSDKCKWYDRTRLNELKNFLTNNKNNYLLFYNYTPELLEIYEICDELGYNIDVYSGEVKSLHFYNKWCKLSDEEKLVSEKNNIILANFASGSTGMNWQEYSQCILFSVPLYKDYIQGIKRIDRTGQKQTTIFHKFYQDNWLDRDMLKAIDLGINYSSELFESDLSKNKLFE